MNKQTSHLRVRMLTEGAMFIAAAQALSYVKLFELPQGGSITIGMLPIFLYCLRWGLAPGMTASLAFSVLQLILDGAYAWSWQSMLGDYIIAFTALGLCGAFAKARGGVFIGPVAGACGRFLSHFVTGATVWREYMPERFFNMTMTSPWFYSLLYNGSYMLIDTVLCLLLILVLSKNHTLQKYLRGEDLPSGK